MRSINSLNKDVHSEILPSPLSVRKGSKFDIVRNVCICQPAIKCRVIYWIKSVCYSLRRYAITSPEGSDRLTVNDHVLSLVSDVYSKLQSMVETFFIDLNQKNVKLHLNIIYIAS